MVIESSPENLKFRTFHIVSCLSRFSHKESTPPMKKGFQASLRFKVSNNITSENSPTFISARKAWDSKMQTFSFNWCSILTFSSSFSWKFFTWKMQIYLCRTRNHMSSYGNSCAKNTSMEFFVCAFLSRHVMSCWSCVSYDLAVLHITRPTADFHLLLLSLPIQHCVNHWLQLLHPWRSQWECEAWKNMFLVSKMSRNLGETRWQNIAYWASANMMLQMLNQLQYSQYKHAHRVNSKVAPGSCAEAVLRLQE